MSASESLRATVKRYREHNDKVATAHGIGRGSVTDHLQKAQDAIHRSRRAQATAGDWQAVIEELRAAVEHLRAGMVRK